MNLNLLLKRILIYIQNVKKKSRHLNLLIYEDLVQNEKNRCLLFTSESRFICKYILSVIFWAFNHKLCELKIIIRKILLRKRFYFSGYPYLRSRFVYLFFFTGLNIWNIILKIKKTVSGRIWTWTPTLGERKLS